MKSVNIMFREKVKEEKGMTLTETLVSLLLMSMVMLIIGNGVIAFKSVYGKTVMRAEAMSLLASLSSAMNADLKSAKNMTFEGDELQFFTSEHRGYEIRFVNSVEEERGGNFEAVFIETYNYETLGTKLMPVLPGAAYAGKLSAKINGIRLMGDYLEYTIEIHNRTTDELILSQECDVAVSPAEGG